MIYGYARVSTKGQAKDGNSLEAQERALKDAGATVIYSDAFTGTKTHRPQLDELLSMLSTVRNKILEWALLLEEHEIVGEGMTFTDEEKRRLRILK